MSGSLKKSLKRFLHWGPFVAIGKITCWTFMFWNFFHSSINEYYYFMSACTCNNHFVCCDIVYIPRVRLCIDKTIFNLSLESRRYLSTKMSAVFLFVQAYKMSIFGGVNFPSVAIMSGWKRNKKKCGYQDVETSDALDESISFSLSIHFWRL